MKVLLVLSLIFAITAPVFGQSATVTWTTTHQTMDGFGANCSNEGINCTNVVNTYKPFDPVNGIGLSIYRDSVPDDGSCSTTCNWNSDNIIPLISPFGVTFFATPWSSPASMKSNGSIVCNTGSDNSSVNASAYGAYATYLESYATQFQSHYGVPLHALSVQNEPDYCPTTYDGAIWTAAQIDSFIKNDLGPTLSGTGIKVMMPEASSWANSGGLQTGISSYSDTCMTDGSCSPYVGIVAGHGYGANYTACTNLGSAHCWETEVYIPQNGAIDQSIANGLLVAQDIHNFLTVANGSAYLYWRLWSGAPDNEGLFSNTPGTPGARYYVMGNWSKFVRPGWVRIDATVNPVSGVYVTAFKDPSAGGFAIVAVNQNSSSANLPVSLAGFPSVTTVTPTLTSANANLVDQSNVDVSTDEFSYSLPANSVVTFHGVASSNSTKAVAPPANLALTVH
jgi:glucuronoarabinoxylan endo-1,4-beta-xylanase